MTWLQFTNLVKEHLLAHPQRLGIPTFLTRQIKNGVRDIQVHAPFFQEGHETVYGPSNLAANGEASSGAMPAEAYPVSLEVQKILAGDRCQSQPVVQWPYAHIRELICGNVAIRGCRYWVAFDDHAATFTIFPAIDDESQVVLGWDGIRDDFADADNVPFNNDVAQAVAYWVQWKLASSSVDKTPGAADANKDNYIIERRKVIRLARERQTLRDATEPDGENLIRECASESICSSLMASTCLAVCAQDGMVVKGTTLELRRDVLHFELDKIYTRLGDVTRGDGLGMSYFWVPESLDADNGGDRLQPYIIADGNPGRLHQYL